MMAQALQHQGFKTRVSKQYSGKPAGRFLGYANAKPGQRVRRNTPIVIKASQGPGVPQGTVGSKASTVVNTLASMHVPVTYKAVTIDASGKSAKKAGTVLATYPKDGNAVKNKSKGIVVAVVQDGDGIPVDYYGKDPDTVKKSLESKGFSGVESKILHKRPCRQGGGDRSGAWLGGKRGPVRHGILRRQCKRHA
ncbi:hypothetical protein WD012_07645 [Bifidobacterium thermophilum]